MSRLNDKVAITTGASLAIGRACTLRMAEAGAAITLADVVDGKGTFTVAQHG